MGKRWKSHELAVAKLLGTTRNANNGQRQNDIDAGRFAVEHKSTKRFSVFLTNALHQAREGAKKARRGQQPIVVVTSSKGQGHPLERYVVMDLSVFMEIAGDWDGDGD